MIRYKIAPKCLLPGPFGHSDVGWNPGVAGTVRSYNLVFTYPCQPRHRGLHRRPVWSFIGDLRFSPTHGATPTCPLLLNLLGLLLPAARGYTCNSITQPARRIASPRRTELHLDYPGNSRPKVSFSPTHGATPHPGLPPATSHTLLPDVRGYTFCWTLSALSQRASPRHTGLHHTWCRPGYPPSSFSPTHGATPP